MSVDRDAPLIVLLLVAFLAAVFLAAAETSLLRMSPVRVASMGESGSRGARVLQALLDDLPQVLSAILLSALLTQITAATVTGMLADRWFGSVGVTVASVVLTIVLFVYGEAIPKTYAVRHTDRVALTLAVPIRILERVLRPVVVALVWIADLQMPGRGITTSPTVTEDELRRLASHAAVEGEITEVDRDLIERAFRFGDRRVDDVMVPRTDIIAVRSTDPVATAMAVALESGHRRLPVHTGTIEEISGVVSLRTLAAIPEPRRASVQAGALASEPLVAPESKRIFELLEEMQRTGMHMAVVIDEFGGTAGIVTLEDIAEELLGSLREEGAGEAAIVPVGDGRWSVDAATPVEDLAAATGVALPDGDWNTVAGLVMALAGRVPEVDERVETDRLRMRIVTVRGRRIRRVEVSLK